MKPFTAWVTLVAVIACFCICHSAAVPFSEVKVEEMRREGFPGAELHLTAESAESTNPQTLFRTKRQSHLSLCHYCCNCCRNKGCGFCCKF